MKRKYIIGLAAVLLLGLIVWTVVQGAIENGLRTVSETERKGVEKHYKSYDAAIHQVDKLYQDDFYASSEGTHLYKLKDGDYFIARQVIKNQEKATYFMESYITAGKNGATVKLPKHVIEKIMAGQKFVSKTWKEQTAIGQIDYSSGDIDRGDNLEDILMINNKGTQGFKIDAVIHKDVINIDNNGRWLTSNNFVIGQSEKMQSYANVNEALKAVLQKVKTPGNQLNEIQTEHFNYYIYKNAFDFASEYTIVPIFKDNSEFKAGKYYRYTFMNDGGIVNSKFVDEIEGYQISIRFNKGEAKAHNQTQSVKDGEMMISVGD